MKETLDQVEQGIEKIWWTLFPKNNGHCDGDCEICPIGVKFGQGGDVCPFGVLYYNFEEVRKMFEEN